MNIINNPLIKLKENIDKEDYEVINELQNICINHEKITLKLELDYKLGVFNSINRDKSSAIEDINEFMYFNNDELIGYIGLCNFGDLGIPIEANGMVHPDYRRKGIFTTLNELVSSELKRRKRTDMLLLSDRNSRSGQEFIKSTKANYYNSEYEMYLTDDYISLKQKCVNNINFRKATNNDAMEIARQNRIYFDRDENSDNKLEKIEIEHVYILPEEEEKRGMTIYLAEFNKKTIGKVHIQLITGLGSIYGLGVLPKYRGKGYGRQILVMAIDKLKEVGANKIMLQVSADNSKALNLYKSCGFNEVSTMDYFKYII